MQMMAGEAVWSAPLGIFQVCTSVYVLLFHSLGKYEFEDTVKEVNSEPQGTLVAVSGGHLCSCSWP